MAPPAEASANLQRQRLVGKGGALVPSASPLTGVGHLYRRRPRRQGWGNR